MAEQKAAHMRELEAVRAEAAAAAASRELEPAGVSEEDAASRVEA
eukprot:CAMPEP_0177664556 /NCGR_PEP_ID=MMETSP0447-20121125/20562_1 /TAXON_ID=0 /ORGANISM="Stygamoeba regulata, Strain BSH-02190019" /LENGTH=44 /DNA_ID= /DNA_START= /DNA_END= /DNA_ORIENTATION=